MHKRRARRSAHPRAKVENVHIILSLRASGHQTIRKGPEGACQRFWRYVIDLCDVVDMSLTYRRITDMSLQSLACCWHVAGMSHAIDFSEMSTTCHKSLTCQRHVTNHWHVAKVVGADMSAVLARCQRFLRDVNDMSMILATCQRHVSDMSEIIDMSTTCHQSLTCH